MVDRLITSVQNRARFALNIGLAEFPGDGLTENELLQSVETAFQQAKTTRQPLVRYAQLEKAERLRGL